MIPEVEAGLRTVGHGAIIDMAHRIEEDGRMADMIDDAVDVVFAALYEELCALPV